MAKTINIPTVKGQKQVTGDVVLFYVGNYQHKFFIHKDLAEGPILSDYASGYRIGALNPIKIRHHRSYSRMTDRAAAEELLRDAANRIGAGAMLKQIKSVPTINA